MGPESLEEGKKSHQKGDLAAAEQQYRAVLTQDSENADAHHLLGALVLIRHGVKEIDVALDHLNTAVRLKPTEAKYRHSLGKAFEAGERWESALTQFQFAVDKDPFTVLYQMSMVKPLTRLRRLQRVIEVCRNVLSLEPAHPKANFKCGSALRQLRREDEALMHYRRHLKNQPDDEQAQFWVSVLAGEDVSHVPASHVASLFDYYAPKFEDHLVNSLEYCTPKALVTVLKQAAQETAPAAAANNARQPWGCCVDLGCGTGLMGPLLRPHVSSLDGVDLSSKMVDRAREKGCYDRLFVEDIVEFLSEQKGRGHCYDLFVAADVLVYIGDLGPLLETVAAVANTGSLLAVSTETATDADLREGAGYKAMLTGRFRHDLTYVKSTAAAQGWMLLQHSQSKIRRNQGQPVMGDLFVFANG